MRKLTWDHNIIELLKLMPAALHTDCRVPLKQSDRLAERVRVQAEGCTGIKRNESSCEVMGVVDRSHVTLEVYAGLNLHLSAGAQPSDYLRSIRSHEFRWPLDRVGSFAGRAHVGFQRRLLILQFAVRILPRLQGNRDHLRFGILGD